MIDLYNKAGDTVTRSQISSWLKKEEDEGFLAMVDVNMSSFLNGLIIAKRGAKDGQIPKAEKKINNNQIFRKLKIAFSMKDTDILDIFDLAEFKISKHELSAIFRKPDQKQYRPCKDQFLRYFLIGLQTKHRGAFERKPKGDTPWLKK
jgi:uncharacterized protein YehS (DUF1456 family)